MQGSRVMAGMPKKIKPKVYFDKSDDFVKGLSLGQRGQVKIKGEITEERKTEEGEDKKEKIYKTIRINSINIIKKTARII